MAELVKTSDAWLGVIPSSWRLAKINTLYDLRNEKVSDFDYPPLSVTMKGILPQLETAAKTNDHSNRKLVKRNDFAINSRSDRRGSCGISDYDGSVSLINTVMKPRDAMNNQYYNWLFHTTQFADEFYKWGHGIVDDLWTTTWADMKNINVPVPPIDIQERIASFLNLKCAEISLLSEDIKRQVVTLEEYKKSIIAEAVTKGLDQDAEMKESGVDWFGAIPAHWQLVRIKDVAISSSGGTPASSNMEYYDGDVKWVCSYDLHECEIYDTEKHLSNIGAKIIAGHMQKPHSILIAMYGGDGTIGNSGLLMCAAKTNQAVCSLYFNEQAVVPEYAFYQIKLLRPYWMYYAAGTRKDPNISQDIIRNMKFIVPDYEEQLSIVNYLNAKCTEINAVIDLKKAQLNMLDDYKKSLIFEYVTGKKEVPNE